MKRTLISFAGAVLAVSFVTAFAQTTERDRLVNEYSTFAGSPQNAQALVGGLRDGSDITLKTKMADGKETSTTFTPQAGKMGYGNVNIALSLAKADLNKQGITNPTPQQIEGSLKNILGARADGKGWGEIANSMGFKLGEVMRSEKAQGHERGERHARAERPERPERPQRPDRPERPERGR
jgi:hypothetical protein